MNPLDILFDQDRFWGGGDSEKPLAEITFQRLDDGHLLVNHTFTDPSLRGQGVARQLVQQVARYARQEGHKLLATCSYARKVLSEPEFADVWDGGRTDAT